MRESLFKKRRSWWINGSWLLVVDLRSSNSFVNTSCWAAFIHGLCVLWNSVAVSRPLVFWDGIFVLLIKCNPYAVTLRSFVSLLCLFVSITRYIPDMADGLSVTTGIGSVSSDVLMWRYLLHYLLWDRCPSMLGSILSQNHMYKMITSLLFHIVFES